MRSIKLLSADMQNIVNVKTNLTFTIKNLKKGRVSFYEYMSVLL